MDSDGAQAMKSTKLWLAASSLALASAFLAFGYIGEETWGSVVQWVIGLYAGGNVLATWAHSRFGPKL